MPNYTISPNMSLLVPIVGQDPGPQWATDLNSSLTLIDQHDHSSGAGVRISPSGLNINSDLSFGNNNLTSIKSARFQPQSAVLSGGSDLGCLYEVTNDLYFNDGVGNQVRITQNGGVAGSPGSIANLSSPASASYVSLSSTFVWQSAASTPANMDAASILLRNLAANSKALTLNPPSSMAANYSLTLPSLPGVQNLVTLDASGNFAAVWNIDNNTLALSANQIKVATHGIGTNELGTGCVTQVKKALRSRTASPAASGNVLFTSSSGNYTQTTSTVTQITNLSGDLVTEGGIVEVSLSADTTNQASNINNFSGTTEILFYRNGSVICSMSFANGSVPPSACSFKDAPSAGTNTYAAKLSVSGGTTQIFQCVLTAYEL